MQGGPGIIHSEYLQDSLPSQLSRDQPHFMGLSSDMSPFPFSEVFIFSPLK